jgi:hypothetical protein
VVEDSGDAGVLATLALKLSGESLSFSDNRSTGMPVTNWQSSIVIVAARVVYFTTDRECSERLIE